MWKEQLWLLDTLQLERIQKESKRMNLKEKKRIFNLYFSLDFFVLSQDKKLVTVYSLNKSENRYEATEATAEAENGYEIVGVSASDFNHDGHLDLLLSQTLKTDTTGTIHHRLFLGDGDDLKLSGWNIPASKDQFLLFDSRGRMLVDFLGVPVGNSVNNDDINNNLMIWSAEADDPQGLVSGYTLTPLENSCKPFSPQSHAFADFNGDGFADLLLICQGKSGNYLKLLISDEKDSTFNNPMTIDLPAGHGPISLGDVDANGSLDLIYAVCYPPETCSQENSIHVLFNTQKPFCNHDDQENCKVLAEIMEADKDFTGFVDSKKMVVDVDNKFKLDTKVPLAIGDYNVNGFPDILAVVRNSETMKNHPILFENVKNGLKRTFTRSTSGTEELEKVSTVTGASFINLYQDGPPDIILNYQDDRTGKSMIKLIQNGFVQDAFFLRTEALNGVCPATCISKKTGSTAHRPYGSSFPGPTVKFSFTDFDGSLRIRSASQLPQSGNGRVSAPFLLFGLGRTNNFVELLAVRTPSRLGPNLARKAGLVPNSDLIINSPHADSPNAFHFELHILPGQYFLWVLISIATATLVLGSLTAYFKWQEIKEDNEERKKAIHSINFDAL